MQFRLLQCFLSWNFRSIPHGGSLILYNSSWAILILQLLIIWSLTWVPIPSNTLSGFLWVVVAKVVLFRGLLNINVVRKVSAVHLMWWYQLSLRYFWVLISFVCLRCMSLSLELPRRSPWLVKCIFEPDLSCPRRRFLLGPFSTHFLPTIF